MWAALKSDLSEFVSTVSSESTQALTSVDNALMSLDRKEEVSSDEGSQESQNEGDISPDTDLSADVEDETPQPNNIAYQAKESPSSDMMDGEMGLLSISDEGFESTGIIATADDEVARLRTQESTYVVDLPDTDDVNEFLAGLDFSSEDLNEEINSNLKSYPGTVQKFYEAFVVQPISENEAEDGSISVTHEQFWARYFYRCNVNRVEHQWALEKEERTRARKAAAEALANGAKQGWGIARNFVGNAMKVVAPVFEEGQSNETATGIMQSFVDGNGGRPPFVLRPTDSSEMEDNEAEEEEELGWDDDDDDDLDDDADTTNESEEIVFGSTDSAGNSVARSAEEAEAMTKEVEQLRMTVFEKDAELAALRAKLEDTEDNDNKETSDKDSETFNSKEYEATKQEVHALKANLEAKDVEIASYKEKLHLLTSANSQGVGETSDSVEDLRSKLTLVEQNISDFRTAEQANQAKYDKEIISLKEKLTKALESKVAADKQLLEQERNLDQAQGALVQIQGEIIAVQEELAAKSEEIDNLRGELKFTQSLAQHAEHLQAENAQLRKELDSATQQESPIQGSPNSSLSSTVKVDTSDVSIPAASQHNATSTGAQATTIHTPAAPGEKSGGDEDDDWGDDGWGDGLEDL